MKRYLIYNKKLRLFFAGFRMSGRIGDNRQWSTFQGAVLTEEEVAGNTDKDTVVIPFDIPD